jgi:hypothetical protein
MPGHRLARSIQAGHRRQPPDTRHGRDVAEEDHPNPKDCVAALFAEASRQGAKIDWVQCGLCVDERGAGEWIEGPRRGIPALVGAGSLELQAPTPPAPLWKPRGSSETMSM